MFQALLSNLNWLHVLVATIAYFMLGAIWYGPLFSKPWVKGHNINVSDPNMKKGVGKIMGLSFVAFFVITFAAAVILHVAQADTAVLALKWGAFLGCCIAAPVIIINHLYLQKPFVIHLIDALYHVIGLIIACLILVLWK
jgi:hypothetical protein